jgi:DNA-binding NtrC family response regulator
MILVAHSNEALRQNVRSALSSQEFEVVESLDKNSVFRFVQSQRPDAVIIGPPPGLAMAALETIEQIRHLNRRISIILVTSDSSEELAIGALRAGANDYLKGAYSLEELAASIRRCLGSILASGTPAGPESTANSLVDSHPMIGESFSMKGIKSCIGTVASASSNVLITGETGTGKELAAELIHKNSSRHQKPFTCINSAAIPDTLLESELFGYEQGAFTGAHCSTEGKLEQSNGGTVFFDEIGDMTLSSQAKILRAIETKRIHRLGGKKSIFLDIKIVAATNQNLEARVAEGKFRRDLYFRLNVMRIHLPPLRERKEDIPALLQHFLLEMNGLYGKDLEGFAEEALEQLIAYDWPGNIRELKNLLETAFLRATSSCISSRDFPEQFRGRAGGVDNSSHCELDRLLVALLSTNWNKSLAAQKLQWSRMTVYRKMAKYRLLTSVSNFKENNQASSHPELVCNRSL